jgi:Na+/proline symporter
MLLSTLDWSFIIAFFVISLLIGIWALRKAGKSTSEFFLSGKNMPWWLLGVSMVATTFAADTPNLVTDIVRKNGVSGNWVWWAFLLTGMLTVFVYAKLWRRLGVMTDLEFYELRYSGKEAAMLRGFRAIYLGVIFNILVMANVCLAAIKIGEVLLDLSAIQTLLIASTVTVIYSLMGGLRGVLLTDFFQFFIAMIGSVWAASVLLDLPQVGGLEGLLSHANVVDKISLLPDFSLNSDNSQLISLFMIPLAVQWWSVWYPGAEPGGGGYIAQRMLAAKSEKHAVGATLFFNVAHYALRPWPWILIALASLIVFPNLESIQAAFPHINEQFINDDLAYPAMLSYLPHGLLGLVIASLIAAFMSTISTHLNWGSSYVVNDFYKRFVKPEATENQLVSIGRLSTALMMVVAALLALQLKSALQGFNILLQIGAGTGLLFIMRWFWWRINAFSEITAMLVSFLLAIYFQFVHESLGFEAISGHWQLILGVGITTIAWVAVTLITRPTDTNTLIRFYELVNPAGNGWKKIAKMTTSEKSKAVASSLPLEILAMLIGCLTVYSALFAVGYWIYSNYIPAFILTAVVGIGAFSLFQLWNKLQIRD